LLPVDIDIDEIIFFCRCLIFKSKYYSTIKLRCLCSVVAPLGAQVLTMGTTSADTTVSWYPLILSKTIIQYVQNDYLNSEMHYSILVYQEFIVVGSYSGILRIFRPTVGPNNAAQPSDLILEKQLGYPILEVACGILRRYN
jgi:PTHB1 N-terminus